MGTVINGPFSSTDEEQTFCAVHPTVATALRCNKCGRYMCSRCAVRTPVGYRCKQCVHEQQDVYFTATTRDYMIAGAVSVVLGIPGAALAMTGFWIILLLASIPAGGFIADLAFRFSGRRRGRYTYLVVAAGIIIGALIVLGFRYMQLSGDYASMIADYGGREVTDALPLTVLVPYLLPIGIYLVLAVGGAVGRLRFGK